MYGLPHLPGNLLAILNSCKLLFFSWKHFYFSDQDPRGTWISFTVHSLGDNNRYRIHQPALIADVYPTRYDERTGFVEVLSNFLFILLLKGQNYVRLRRNSR